MSRIRVKHVTGFAYDGEVTASYNEARMLPSTGEGQYVLFANLEISPMSSSHGYLDYWGTRVNSFEILTTHRQLSLTATSLVEVRRAERQTTELGWDELAASMVRRVDAVEQVRQTKLTDVPDEVAALAAEIAGRTSPNSAALEICQAVSERIEYVQGVTEVGSTATEAWNTGKGVCQDITHVALGALRAAGIPARYVSGYLHPNAEAEIGETVAGESHAWVEWFCGDEWRGWDPTNRSEIGDRHVLVGRGRDYSDVAPLRGVYAGPFTSELFVSVDITREA